MKLTVEIKDDEFIYSFNIGSTTGGGIMPFNLEGLKLFNDLVSHLHKNVISDKSKKHEAISAYAFCKAYPELIEEIEGWIMLNQKNAGYVRGS